MNFHELDNFNLADAVKFHRRLNPALWGTDEHLLPEVREKLLAVADDFREFLGVDDLKLVDITLSGSNAAYSYTANSDIDLHLVVEMPDDPVYQELFDAKKYQYNDTHNIRIGGADVELYVQPADQAHHSQGIYSVKNSDWLQVPQRRRAKIDDNCVQSKTADLDARIHAAIKTKNLEVIDSLWRKIKTMRQTGLEKNGEFGCENIAFKLLRNQGCIADLLAAKTAARDQELSLKTRPRERKTVNYGMRDYWYPGTAYAGQDHPAGTEAEQVDESTDPDQLRKILNRFYSSCVNKLQLENPPELRLETTPEWSQENGSFGQYDSDSNTLILATSGRHVLDILRTMAHEMTHRQQDEREPLPIDAGATGSPWEDQANAMAGRIMRDWADEQPEMFDGVTLEEASGYIPKNKKEARDPRFSMALTRDVRPGAVGKEANKLGLQTDAQGHPALLMKSTNTLAESLARELELFEEQDLFEINMGSKNLRREAAKTGALAGMEFEMYVPNTDINDTDSIDAIGDKFSNAIGRPVKTRGSDESEADMDRDQSVRDIDGIVNFFDDNDLNSRSDIRRLRDKLYEDFREWQYEQIGEGWYDEGRDFLRDYVVNNGEFDGGEAEDTAREELEQDLFYRDLPEAERDQMVEKRTGEMLDEFVEQEWTSQDGRIYEAAREEYDSDMQDDYDEFTWLRDIGIDQMSDVQREYTISWPYYTENEDPPSPGPGDDYYKLITDASLRFPESPDDGGLEFISPPFPVDQMLSDLNKVVAWAKQTGCYTNDSTGLHINISIPGFGQQLDFVKLAVLLGDEQVLENFGRAGNRYAESAMKIVKDNIRSRPESAAALLIKMKSNMDSLASKAIHTGKTNKFTSINTKTGYVEFRSPGGDWLDDNFDQIEPTLLRFVVAMDAAVDPEKYRQEYQKKLYKLLTTKSESADTNELSRILSMYLSGQADQKTAARDLAQQATTRKKNKKDPGSFKEPAAPAATSGSRQRYVVRNAAGNPVTTVTSDGVGSEGAAAARVLANLWLQQNNPGINTNEFSVELATEPAQTNRHSLQNYYISDAQSSVARMAFRAANDAEALDRWEIYNYSHPRDGGYRLSREDGTVVTEPGAPVAGSTLDLQRQRQAAAAPTPVPGVQDIDIDIPIAQPRGFWNGQWKIVDGNTGEELYRFGGIGNSQVDANRIAGEWVRTNSISVPTEVYPVLSDGSDVNEQVVNELKINNASGIGAVPNNQQIGYQGLQVVMRPSMFLELALPLDVKSADERETIEYIKKNLDEKGVGAPWLTVVIPEAWESEDFSQMAHVSNHDGRHRMHSILEQEGNDPVEVHIIVPHMRRRHITDAMVDQLRSGVLNQQGQYVSGPVFGAAK
jgi:hypothetical protein